MSTNTRTWKGETSSNRKHTRSRCRCSAHCPPLPPGQKRNSNYRVRNSIQRGRDPLASNYTYHFTTYPPWIEEASDHINLLEDFRMHVQPQACLAKYALTRRYEQCFLRMMTIGSNRVFSELHRVLLSLVQAQTASIKNHS